MSEPQEHISQPKTSCSCHHGAEKHQHDGHQPAISPWRDYVPAAISAVLLLTGICATTIFHFDFFTGWLQLVWYIIAYFPVALPVFKQALATVSRGAVFTEFTLMVVATLGAFSIGEYPEAVAVMLFYTVGELLQEAAVTKAKRNIRSLLDVRPDVANVLTNGVIQLMDAKLVEIGALIEVKVGEKNPLDGIIAEGSSYFNTAALTGESAPRFFCVGDELLAGMINTEKVVQLRVTKRYDESAIAKILELVQHATTRKAPTELFIRKFAAVYTPVVFFLAIAVVLVPAFLVQPYIFEEWLYRGLVFLVISCPCALVISIPLGYFGGIGAASRQGILFKGSNYLDIIAKANTVVLDKTGTLTKGVFKVKSLVAIGNDDGFLSAIAALERFSNHPAAKAIQQFYGKDNDILQVSEVTEIAGFGLKGKVAGKSVIAGNLKLLQRENIPYPEILNNIDETVVVAAFNGIYAGHITISDELKEDASGAIAQLQQQGISNVMLLSGDNNAIVKHTAEILKIKNFKGNLLPADKLNTIEELKSDPRNIILFAGDGINDTPVLTASHVGIAMGGLGADAAIETADVVIQTDQPSKIPVAISIGKATRKIVWQNILMAFVVKAIVLVLGAGGLANMWEAVFADVGVALLAVLNAVRIQRMTF